MALKVANPQPYIPAVNKNCAVAAARIWTNAGWNWQLEWRRELRKWEQIQGMKLLDLTSFFRNM
jgi:hypothetical protein